MGILETLARAFDRTHADEAKLAPLIGEGRLPAARPQRQARQERGGARARYISPRAALEAIKRGERYRKRCERLGLGEPPPPRHIAVNEADAWAQVDAAVESAQAQEAGT